MPDWKKQAQIFEDVIFFSYVTSQEISTAPLVYVWDLDKTYLETHFETLKGLLKAALEKAFQKRNVPGTNTLIKALISGQGKGQREFPIFFITASPPQIEHKIKQKLGFDGIRPFGSFFKDNLQNLKPSRFWRLTNHMGYKIQALLELRVRLRENVQQILWGDDSEMDAVVYSLYSDICARRLPPNEMLRVLKGLSVESKQIENIFALQERIPIRDPVEKIYINLAADTDPEYYLKFGRRMVATYDTFQAALDLFQDGRLDVDQVVGVAEDMVNNYAFTPDELGKTLEDLIQRQILHSEKMKEILLILQTHQLLPRDFRLGNGEKKHNQTVDTEWVPSHIEYLIDYR